MYMSEEAKTDMARVVWQVARLNGVVWRSVNVSRRTEITHVLTRFQAPSGSRTFKMSCERFQDDSLAEHKKEKIDNRLIRREDIDLETSKRYMESKAYQITYGADPVWVPYRRNHKGQIPPEKTRYKCVYKGKITTGNPCPICRDEYLVIHPENIALLKQFISPQTGDVLPFSKTGLCRKRHKSVLIAVEQAWDYGYIEKPLPFREYDYTVYFPQLKDIKEA